ncbi:MAG: UDP-N-acetylmuramoyl-L-alanine--D-glutamate ligase [Polaromonas sp.]
MKQLAQKNILVLGLGASGLALARWCVRWGAQVTVADTRAAPPQLEALRTSVPAARFINAEMNEALLATAAFDMVLKSPGLSPASVAAVITAAEARGIACGNELSLFAQALADLKEDRAYAPRVIGITGTNGKTTVTSLTAQLVQRAGKSVAVAGNIGPTLLDTLAEKLDAQVLPALPDVWVLELSSFQLDRVTNFEPSVATVLNITQDHLDWHETLTAYIAAKAHVYGSAGLMLLNRNDPLVMAALPPLVKGRQLRDYLTFGNDEPQRPGDYGIETVNGMAWLVRAAEADETIKRRKDEEVVLHIQRLMPLDALRIRGRHNATNALAALGLAVAVDCALAPMLHGLREYRGEPHRVESVAVVNEVEYFDDSKGTNVGATAAALAGLGAERKLVLILGGVGKGQDFSPLAEPVSRHARAVVLIGRDAPLIRAALQASHVPLLDATSMPEAVALAAQQAQTGDAVLMSPACASFDMFDNYEHRARVFCEAVQALAREQGAVL